MRVTFELPPPVLQRLRSYVPRGERSRFVAQLISNKLRNKGSALARAAQKANTLRKVNRDMKDWAALGKSPRRRLSLVEHFKRLKGLELPPYLDE
ncbi:MAG TPA: hypothetical protein VN765_04985 [Candidatus Acidoferrum sp.]|nr:hypothetical protein [Candidatus Acidoferrum sp.]